MADTILTGDLTVYYLDDTRRKQIKWTGGTLKTDTRKMIEVYDATEDLMTSPVQMDDGLIFSAETPGEYTIGLIDAGEVEPWFIDLGTMEHIIGDFANFTGCALKTSGWARVTGTNTGIVVVPVSSGGTIVPADVGNTISHADGDSGTLLDVTITGGATDYLWIRPDTSAIGDDWDSTSGTITEAGTSHTATQSLASVSGEMVWGNVFSQGTVQSDTHIYVYQNELRVTAFDQTDQDWWPDGQVDRAVPITDYTTDAFPIIDEGYLTVKANKYSTGYTYAIIRMNTTSGGNVSAPLSSGVDSANTTGYKSITFTTSTGNWNVGDEITGDTSGARGIITRIDSPGATQTVHYYLVGDPLTDFQTAAENLTNEDDTGTGAKDGNAPANEGPADTAWFDGSVLPTYAFANAQFDIADTGTPQEWAITIDLNQASLAQMYEYNKYVTRRGSLLDLDGQNGEEYIGIDYAVNYSTITGTVGEGSTVTGATSGATAVVVSNPAGSSNVSLLRSTRGTFVDGEAIEIDGSNRFDASGLTVEAITPVAAATFGTLAGGLFFGTRGVLLSDYKSAEENSFSLIDATGVTRQRPTSITILAQNLAVNDWVAAYRLSTGSINKTEYSATGGEAEGAGTLTVDGSIASDVPNKDNGGRLVLRDVSDNSKEYVIRFSSFVPATGVVTLANTSATAEALTSTTQIVDTGVFTAANVQVGDLVVNTTRDLNSYVTERTDDNTIQIDPPIAGQTTGDLIEINAIPNLGGVGDTVNTSDDVYFTLMHKFIDAGNQHSVSMQYIADIDARGRTRNTSAATTKIKGFTVDFVVGTGGGSFTAVRTENTVYGS